MTTLFTTRPRLAILAVMLIFAAGVGAFITMGRQEDPTLIERYAIVVTPFPGASAERVEALVAEPLESRILELAEIKRVRSTLRAGTSQMEIELREDLSASQVDQAWSLVRDQVDLASQAFPPGVGPSVVDRQYIGAATMIVALSWEDGRDDTLGLITRLARDLDDRLQTMDGTEETRLFGVAEEEIRVLVDRDKLWALGLTVSDLAARLQASDAKAPAGQVRADNVNLGVEVSGELDSLGRVRGVTVKQGPQGRTVRLGDVAAVEKGVRTPPTSIAHVNGDRVVMVAAYLQPGLRVDQWTKAARQVVQEFQSSLPRGVSADIVFEQNRYVKQRLNGLAQNLGFSVLLVFAVLLLAMGWRAALIVGAALPLTVLMVITFISASGNPLHQMSVTGIIIALGLLIDNAIVMVDEIRLKRARGADALTAVDRSTRHLFAPLLASTATTMLAFAPIAMMSGSAGEFVGSMGLSVIFAVGSSLFLSLTIIPALSAWFDHAPREDGKTSIWRDGLSPKWLAWLHKQLVRTVVRVPFVGIALGLSAPVAGFVMASTLPMQFFPPTDRDMFQLEAILPPEASIAETRRLVREITEVVEAHEEVTQVSWVMGEQPPRTYYNVSGEGAGQQNFAAGWVRTKSPEATRTLVTELQSTLRAQFPEARILALPFAQGPPVPAPLELYVYGPDFQVLSELGDDIRALMAASENVTYTTAGLRLGAPVARVQADEAQAAIVGLSLTELAGLVQSDLDGAVGGSVLEGAEDLPVRVVLPDESRADLSAVRGKILPGQNGAATPLSALGGITLEPEAATIVRDNGERANVIYGFIDPFSLPAVALSDFLARLEASDVVIPEGYRLRIGGDAEQSGNAIGQLFGAAAPLLVLMMGALVLAFNSFRFAGVVALVGIQSVGLAMLGVWAFGQPNGFMAIVGAMGLVGLAINGSIVVLSALRSNDDAANGDRSAIVDTTMDATRHIVATTFTTIGGFIPLIVSGDSFWMPLATAIAGGVGGSAILALYFTPAVFSVMAKRRRSHAARDTEQALPASTIEATP